MTDPELQSTLPEEDYLSILSIIRMLASCDRRTSLNKAIQEKIFPLVSVQSCIIRYMDPDFGDDRLIDLIIDEDIRKEPLTIENKKSLQKWMVFGDAIRDLILENERPVLTLDGDIPKEKILNARREFQEIPESRDYPIEQRPHTGFIIMDKPDHYIVLSFHRYEKVPITNREIRILELLCPHIILAIKGVLTKEALSKYKDVAIALTNTPTSIALIDFQSRVLFCNTSFKNIVGAAQGDMLPKELADFLRGEISSLVPEDSNLDSSLKLSFFRINGIVYRLCLIPLGLDETSAEPRWLLKIKPPSEQTTQINMKLKDAGLTPREMELACLMLDEMEDQKISERLFISYHTVRAHIKSIYKKLNVASRLEFIRTLKT